MWVHDRETLRFLAVNETACRQYGWSCPEFLAMSVTDLGPWEQEPPGDESVMAAGDEFASPRLVRHVREDGTTLAVEISARALVFENRPAQLVLAHDVSQRRQLEETLARAVKMEAIGRLAGGVAHDFNNVLVVVTGYAELIARRTDDVAILEAVQAMKTAGERAAGLTRQLAAVSRRQALVPKPLSLNEVVRGLRPLFTQLLGADVALEFSLARDAPTVLADPSQLEQVVLNLVVNARDAMPDGGRLTIETHAHSLSGRLADERFDLPPGRYAVLRVSDTGVGMDRETLARIFEPFFTTKSETTGTGLGLATVYGIVKQSGGDVWVYSEPGEGTVFKIYLPEADGDADIETTEVDRDARCLADKARSCSSRTTQRSEGSWKRLSPRTGTRSSRRAMPRELSRFSAGSRSTSSLPTSSCPGSRAGCWPTKCAPARPGRGCCSSQATPAMRLWLAASPRTTRSCRSPSTSRSSSSRCARRSAAHEGQSSSMRSNLRPLEPSPTPAPFRRASQRNVAPSTQRVYSNWRESRSAAARHLLLEQAEVAALRLEDAAERPREAGLLALVEQRGGAPQADVRLGRVDALGLERDPVVRHGRREQITRLSGRLFGRQRHRVRPRVLVQLGTVERRRRRCSGASRSTAQTRFVSSSRRKTTSSTGSPWRLAASTGGRNSTSSAGRRPVSGDPGPVSANTRHAGWAPADEL